MSDAPRTDNDLAPLHSLFAVRQLERDNLRLREEIRKLRAVNSASKARHMQLSELCGSVQELQAKLEEQEQYAEALNTLVLAHEHFVAQHSGQPRKRSGGADNREFLLALNNRESKQQFAANTLLLELLAHSQQTIARLQEQRLRGATRRCVSADEAYSLELELLEFEEWLPRLPVALCESADATTVTKFSMLRYLELTERAAQLLHSCSCCCVKAPVSESPLAERAAAQ